MIINRKFKNALPALPLSCVRRCQNCLLTEMNQLCFFPLLHIKAPLKSISTYIQTMEIRITSTVARSCIPAIFPPADKMSVFSLPLRYQLRFAEAPIGVSAAANIRTHRKAPTPENREIHAACLRQTPDNRDHRRRKWDIVPQMHSQAPTATAQSLLPIFTLFSTDCVNDPC